MKNLNGKPDGLATMQKMRMNIRWNAVKQARIVGHRFLVGCSLWVLSAVIVVSAYGFPSLSHAAELVMIEQKACPYCERWHEEIGAVYPKTSEGRLAPLRVVDIHEDVPAEIMKLAPGRFTPTFILVAEGAEIGRIRGYPGEELFWWHLSALIKKMQSHADEPPLSTGGGDRENQGSSG